MKKSLFVAVLLFVTSIQTNTITSYFSAKRTEAKHEKSELSLTKFEKKWAIVSKYMYYVAMVLVSLQYLGLESFMVLPLLKNNQKMFVSYLAANLLGTALMTFSLYKSSKIYDYAIQKYRQEDGAMQSQQSETSMVKRICPSKEMLLIIAGLLAGTSASFVKGFVQAWLMHQTLVFTVVPLL